MRPNLDFELLPMHRPFSTVVRAIRVIKTGTDSGWIDVGLTIHGSRPEPLPGWEEVHEVEQVTITGELRVWSLEGVPVDPPLPRYCAEPESRLGIRLHVTGRAEGERAGIVSGTPVERHHIQLWPL